jgi:hypothetical protein
MHMNIDFRDKIMYSVLTHINSYILRKHQRKGENKYAKGANDRTDDYCIDGHTRV